MDRILIFYGTTDGHTRKVASFVADQLRARGADVELVEAGRTNTPDPSRYAGVIVAASIHVSAYQRAVQRWVAAHAATLQSKPTAFLSVCLAVLQPDPQPQRDLAAIWNGSSPGLAGAQGSPPTSQARCPILGTTGSSGG
jgi:menaquinone-dependent protoporphyrinogen oxidase